MALKANAADVDTALGAKADTTSVYSRTDVDTALDAKADAATTFSKQEVTTALDVKADTTSLAQLKTDVTSGIACGCLAVLLAKLLSNTVHRSQAQLVCRGFR